MTTETRKRRNYTEDFKWDAVALVTEQGYKPSEAAQTFRNVFLIGCCLCMYCRKRALCDYPLFIHSRTYSCILVATSA